jgi:hypothetical protein
MANTTDQKPGEQKTYKQAAGEYYNKQYDSWMPWIEDKYLSWFTKDNKASYATKRKSYPSPPPDLLCSVHCSLCDTSLTLPRKP